MKKTIQVDELQNTLINNGLVKLYHQVEYDHPIKEEILSLIKIFELFTPDKEGE